MRLYAFRSGGDWVDKAVQDPLDPGVGTKLYEPWTCYVVDHPQGPVLFDTGSPAEILVDPVSVLGPGGGLVELVMSEAETTVALLASIGLEPADIPIVVMSHLHHDHAAALALFGHAQIHAQKAELAFARNPPVYQQAFYVPAQFEGAYDWQLADGEVDLFADASVVVFPTPGHTRGHQSARVTLDNETVILVFDATYSLEKMRQRSLPGIVWNPDALVASWELIEQQAAAHSAVLLSSHDPDLDRVKWAPDAWYQ